MKYTITVLEVPGYPFPVSQFNERFDKHIKEHESDKEMVQMWHSHKSETNSGSFDYYHILWKLR